jgi:hypothetical protein|tara:strand:- start:280 stop:867 length:588 start_codon:yes stop_codon:yes gene_type:complete
MSCIGKNFNLDSRLGLDDCALVANEKQNIQIKDYELFNPIEDCTDRRFDKVALCNNMVITNGYGNSDSCNIDIDSRLRNGGELTNHGILNQKFRKCQDCDDDKDAVENRIKRGNDFGLKRCDVISEVSTLDLQFTPMIPCLSHNIQNAEHIVFNPNKIVWGGQPTRDSLQQKKFLERQGFKFNKKGIAEQACGFS